MLIQWTTKGFEDIAKANGIETRKVMDGKMNGTNNFLAYTVYEYISPNTGEIVSVVETGTGNYTDAVVMATVMVKGKITEKDARSCVLAVERKY